MVACEVTKSHTASHDWIELDEMCVAQSRTSYCQIARVSSSIFVMGKTSFLNYSIYRAVVLYSNKGGLYSLSNLFYPFMQSWLVNADVLHFISISKHALIQAAEISSQAYFFVFACFMQNWSAIWNFKAQPGNRYR